MMKVLNGALAAAAIASLVACEQGGVTHAGPDAGGRENAAASPKKPLVFDVSKILYPPARPGAKGNAALPKSASTYYAFWAGSGLSWSDYNFLCFSGCGAIGSMMEATYSPTMAANPENLWLQNHGPRLISGPITHNEQTEVHFFIPTGSGTPGGFSTRYISLGWEVSTELNYDKLYITSTASDGTCNSPGVIRQVESGTASGTASFSVPGNCGQIWVGVYYIKDGSVHSGNDQVNILNFSVTH